jgi:hypothetical protein
METGFGQNLEGFLIKGNLSLSKAAIPSLQGDGSIEGSGTLYIDSIKEYTEFSGINVHGVSFLNGQLIIPYTAPSHNLTTASILTDGGLSIRHTQNAASITSGGALSVAGGASIFKNCFVGGVLDVNGNYIENVKDPDKPQDAATKRYVDDNRFTGNFTAGQVIIANGNGDTVRGFSNFTYDGSSLTLHDTSGGLICKGGASIGGVLDVERIVNLEWPTEGTDAANKDYVDSRTHGSLLGSAGNYHIVVGTSDPSAITSYPTFTFDGSLLSLSTSASMIINNTGSSLVAHGDVSIYKDLYVGGELDVNGNFIVNVKDPIDPQDAATKKYVDDRKLQGNFTTGQLIIADSNGDAIRGYDNIAFQTDGTRGTLVLDKYTNAVIQNSSDASGLGIGGGFTALGGASFLKNVYIGGQLDVNNNRITSVADPIEAYDAVNKAYVDSLLDVSTGGDNSLILSNNSTVPIDIDGFTFDSTVRAFVCYIYVNYNYEKCAIYTIRGVNTTSNWYIVNTFVGEPTNVDFFIRKDGEGNGIIQYTNKNLAGLTSIQYRTYTQLNETASGPQSNFTLDNDTSDFVSIPSLVFNNTEVDGAKIIIHVSNLSHDEDGIVFMNVMQRNGEWIHHINTIGDISKNIKFRIVSTGTHGIVQYINTNTNGEYTLRFRKFQIAHLQSTALLLANTTVPQATSIQDFTFQKTQTNFNLVLYIEIPETSKYALYEIEAVSRNFDWKVNTRFIGDPLGLSFYIDSNEDSNVLKYTNPNMYDARIKYSLNTPPTFQPIPVSKGGTGKTYLTPYAVLRGNGSSAVLASSDFIYKDKTLILGTESSILLKNTTPALGVGSGGSLTVLGGAAISQNLVMGDVIDMQNNNIINVKDPENLQDAVNKKYVDKLINDVLATSSSFVLDNNVSIPENIPDYVFSSDTKAFVSYVYVTYNNNTTAMYCLKGIKRQSNWFLSTTFVGKNTNVDFSIIDANGIGQMQYVNNNVAGVTSVKYRTVTLIKDDPVDQQLNLSINSNVTNFASIPELDFSNGLYNSVQVIVYVSNDTHAKYGMYMLNCLLQGDSWILNTYSSGNVSGLQFQISTEGVIEYTNNNAHDFMFRIQQAKILKSQSHITLEANTASPTPVDNTFLAFEKGQYIFHLIAYVEVPSLNKYALYDIEGLYGDGVWKLNSTFVGDRTGVMFSMQTSTYGLLTYTNNNGVDAIVKYIIDSPLVIPLPVKKGGTGKTFLQPNAVLRGNGIDPILATADFVYENETLRLGASSSIVIENTANAVSLSQGGTITSYGGVAIKRTLLVGESLQVNGIDITPNVGDINQKTFLAANGQSVPAEVTGFSFSNPVIKSFIGVACITTETVGDTLDSLYELKGLRKKNGWIIQSTHIGDDVGVEFDISTSGDILYTSAFIEDWQGTVMKFRATTTTIM